jgi:hypothetical protein
MSRVVTHVFSTELGIRLSFFKTSELFLGGGLNPPKPPSVRHWIKQLLVEATNCRDTEEEYTGTLLSNIPLGEFLVCMEIQVNSELCNKQAIHIMLYISAWC